MRKNVGYPRTKFSPRSLSSRRDLGEISLISPWSRRDLVYLAEISSRSCRNLCDNTNLANLAEISVKFLHGSDTQQFLRSYNNSSSGFNLTPYSGVIFWGVILTPKRRLKNSSSGGVILYLNFYSTFRVKVTPKRVKTTHLRSNSLFQE